MVGRCRAVADESKKGWKQTCKRGKETRVPKGVERKGRSGRTAGAAKPKWRAGSQKEAKHTAQEALQMRVFDKGEKATLRGKGKHVVGWRGERR